MEVTPANVFEGDVASELVQANGAAPTQLLGDMAYSGGETRAEVAGAKVVAKVPPTPPTGRFSKDEFTIDPYVLSATCPAGVVATEVRSAERIRRGWAAQDAWCSPKKRVRRDRFVTGAWEGWAPRPSGCILKRPCSRGPAGTRPGCRSAGSSGT